MLHSLVFIGRLSPLKHSWLEENISILLLQCTRPLKRNKTLIFLSVMLVWFGFIINQIDF